MKKQPVLENLGLVQNTLEHWLSFKRYVMKGFGEDAITPEDETGFLEVKSSVAKNIRSLTERLKEVGNFDFGGTIVRDQLNKCVSVGHLRALPMSDRRAMLKEWHVVFVRLSRTVGALKFISEGYVPQVPGAKKKKGGPPKGAIIGVVAVVVIVAVAVVLKVLGVF